MEQIMEEEETYQDGQDEQITAATTEEDGTNGGDD